MSEKKDQPIAQLSPTGLNGFDYVSTRYDALVGIGQKPEDLLNPAYWSHQAMKLKPMDEIRARAEDGTWMGYYMVLDCSRTWAKVKELHRFMLGTAGRTSGRSCARSTAPCCTTVSPSGTRRRSGSTSTRASNSACRRRRLRRAS